MMKWQPIETAPRDGRPIIGLCRHSEDSFLQDDGRLTVYAAHGEGLGQVPDGPHILCWGGEYDDPDDGYIPAWWFRYGSEWEEVANPTCWAPVPEDFE